MVAVAELVGSLAAEIIAALKKKRNRTNHLPLTFTHILLLEAQRNRIAKN